MENSFAQLDLVPQTKQLLSLMTIVRDRSTDRQRFVFASDRVFRLLIEEGLSKLPYRPKTVIAPTGVEYQGFEFAEKICGVSIIRAGESIEAALRQVCEGVRIGKILIQRDEETARPMHFYTKLPKDIGQRHVLLLDPMLATGGSAAKAIEILIDHGVPEQKIVFICMVAAPEGVAAITTRFPKLKIVAAALDSHLNERNYIIPGLGDFGDRYFGTTDD
eukprot:gnl/Trimastix_PCT/262.p1 GENE.gnl/Trimastix_PCT/262~~gnl/Trimastix_PCT/262.p1  ORF type:complete len:245 (+),score=72.90 gnl/Trimastix_PCT/262:80-736(+)